MKMKPKIIAGLIALMCIVALIFGNRLIDLFVRNRIISAYEDAFPEQRMEIADLHFNIWDNQIVCSDVMMATDSTFSCTIDSISAIGISWMSLLGNSQAVLAKLALNGWRATMEFPQSLYTLRCDSFGASAPDSGIVIDRLTFSPAGADEEFFDASRFRRTRFRLEVRQSRCTGVDFHALEMGEGFRTHIVEFDGLSLEILINKEKRARRDSTTFMPNELLAKLGKTMRIDSLRISDGSLSYCERFAKKGSPAILTFDDVSIVARDIDTIGDTSVFRGRAIFAKGGTMGVEMHIPLASQDFSLSYSGALSGMPIARLNPWLVISDNIRVKSGRLNAASFQVDVLGGHAKGTVRALYRDLEIATLDRESGSEEEFDEQISSLVANLIQIRGTNLADRSGKVKIGKVEYARKRDDPFFGFIWSALRSGVGDVVGF